MSLAPGVRLGPYQVTAPLGEGGMGVVYRATDPKLKREVAIKVLPEAFAADADRLARFEREAQLLAQLQHPDIASIYGLEEPNGARALVIELVEGEDLAERLKHGPFPLGEALSVARQVAEALEAAHEKGIVHRDLATGAETTLFSSKETYSTGPMSLSPDGAAMTCEERSRLAYADLVLRPSHGEGETKVLVRSPHDDAYGQISPDGRWLQWASDDSGRYEVYVAPFPGGGSRVQVSREGGTQPRWNPAGGEILLKTPDNVLTAVRIETGSGTISVGSPTPLFPIVEFTGWTYDVTADGTRFLVREPLAERDASPITLLTDRTALAGTR